MQVHSERDGQERLGQDDRKTVAGGQIKPLTNQPTVMR